MDKRYIVNFVGIITRQVVKRFGPILGMGRLLNLLFPAQNFFNSSDYLVKIDDNLCLRLNLSSHLERILFFHGYYRKTELYLNVFLKNGGVALDCGANIGNTLRMANIVGREGKVVAVEPFIRVRQRLINNIKLNDCEPIVHVLPYVLGDTTGMVKFKCPPSSFINQGNASLYSDEKGWFETEVKMMTIDNIISSLKLKRMNLIKVDAQGNEFKVLKGAASSIIKFHPVITLKYSSIVFEKGKYSLNALLNYLNGMHYDTFFIRKSLFCSFDIEKYDGKPIELIFIPCYKHLKEEI
jgi:FkbM family methyltransferase